MTKHKTFINILDILQHWHALHCIHNTRKRDPPKEFLTFFSFVQNEDSSIHKSARSYYEIYSLQHLNAPQSEHPKILAFNEKQHEIIVRCIYPSDIYFLMVGNEWVPP